MARKKKELTPQERLLQLIQSDHHFYVSTYPCEFGDHVQVYCSCGWEGKDTIDQSYEYSSHLAQQLIESGFFNIPVDPEASPAL